MNAPEHPDPRPSLSGARRATLARVATLALILLLVGWLPGHGGNSGGVVVLPHAVATPEGPRPVLDQHAFGAGSDLLLKVPAELEDCSVVVTADGERLQTEASLDGSILTIAHRDLADLASVSIVSTRFVLASACGCTLILDVQYDAASGSVELTVR